jgi:hypothetical protein
MFIGGSAVFFNIFASGWNIWKAIHVRHRGLKDMPRSLDLSLEQFVHCLTGELRLLGILKGAWLFLQTACSIMFWISDRWFLMTKYWELAGNRNCFHCFWGKNPNFIL